MCLCGPYIDSVFVGHVPFFRDGLWILRTARKYLSCPEAVDSSSLVPLLGIPLSGRGYCLATGIQTLFHFSLILKIACFCVWEKRIEIGQSTEYFWQKTDFATIYILFTNWKNTSVRTLSYLTKVTIWCSPTSAHPRSFHSHGRKGDGITGGRR